MAQGSANAEACGIIIADTKFEFGLVPDRAGPDEDRVMLIDEVLTPDSSRFWPRDQYRTGWAQPSFDKQFVRDYLERIRWNKQPPAPSLPDEVILQTREKYVEAFRRLTARDSNSLAMIRSSLSGSKNSSKTWSTRAFTSKTPSANSRAVHHPGTQPVEGSLTKTAGALGIHRNTLSRKIGAYKIKPGAG